MPIKKHTRKIRKTKNKRKTIYGGSPASRSRSRSRSPASRRSPSPSPRRRGIGKAASDSTWRDLMGMFGLLPEVRTREDDIVEHVGVIWVAFIYYLYTKLEQANPNFNMGTVFALEDVLSHHRINEQKSKFDAMQKVFDHDRIFIDVRKEHAEFLEEKGDAIQGALKRYPGLRKGY